MINRENYEIWFIDYFDGKLSPEQTAELLLFLEENGDLKLEFDSFSNITLPEQDVKFENKMSLKKNVVGAENFEEFAIGYLENTLTDEQKESYLNFIQENPAYKKEHDLFAQTRFSSEDKVVFAHKNLLKHETGKIRTLSAWWYASAAACITAVVFVYLNQQPDTQIAEVPVNVTKEIPVNTTHTDTQPVNIHENVKSAGKDLASAATNSKPERKKAVRNKLHSSSHVESQSIETINNVQELAMLKAEIDVPESELSIIPFNGNLENAMAVVEPEKTEKVTEILREMAVKRLNTLAMNQEIDLPENTKRVKVLALFGRIVKRVTFQKVNIETTYSPEGKLMAYQVTAGKLSFEKQIEKQ
ncbi:MAG: hypothetical protein FNNCIFGK_00565 [Bacteroidia bacterium]|nr:hypothetical protein [Bacteroidia bacterium]MBX3105288.1 hypothetical protein [Bacteroidota bacterium]MCE7955666.1 hypothetical protein [Bacteroidetes bacterium CHB6]